MAFRIDDQCNGCGVCAKMCPVAAITGEKETLHVVSADICIECGVCGRLCPQEAVLDASGERQKRKKRAEWLRPRIGEDCASCNICIDICPFGCLELAEPKPKADKHAIPYLAHPKKCVSCRMCDSACPLGAIEMSPGLS